METTTHLVQSYMVALDELATGMGVGLMWLEERSVDSSVRACFPSTDFGPEKLN